MSKHDPKVTLLQIRDFAHKAQSFCEGKTLPEIIQDWRDTLAFERSLELIGEAVKRLPIDLRDRYPTVPWKNFAGLRDRVSHGYETVDYQILWDTVEYDLPLLLRTVEQMLRDLEQG
jgi:uncharacterized protein with HEPN domain